MTSGFNYQIMQQQSDFFTRKSWPLPKEHRQLAHVDCSSDGCRKKRVAVIGHRSRTKLWVWMCMIHQTVIAFHIIKKGEGRRDPLLSLFRFKKEPPSAIFVDCACQAEESALNWLPKYYINTNFFHDTFHGFAHKCCDRFESRHQLPYFPKLNTSLMEQLNSYLQTLRGLVCSPTTKVTCSTLQ